MAGAEGGGDGGGAAAEGGEGGGEAGGAVEVAAGGCDEIAVGGETGVEGFVLGRVVGGPDFDAVEAEGEEAIDSVGREAAGVSEDGDAAGAEDEANGFAGGERFGGDVAGAAGGEEVEEEVEGGGGGLGAGDVGLEARVGAAVVGLAKGLEEDGGGRRAAGGDGHDAVIVDVESEGGHLFDAAAGLADAGDTGGVAGGEKRRVVRVEEITEDVDVDVAVEGGELDAFEEINAGGSREGAAGVDGCGRVVVGEGEGLDAQAGGERDDFPGRQLAIFAGVCVDVEVDGRSHAFGLLIRRTMK